MKNHLSTYLDDGEYERFERARLARVGDERLAPSKSAFLRTLMEKGLSALEEAPSEEAEAHLRSLRAREGA